MAQLVRIKHNRSGQVKEVTPRELQTILANPLVSKAYTVLPETVSQSPKTPAPTPKEIKKAAAAPVKEPETKK